MSLVMYPRFVMALSTIREGGPAILLFSFWIYCIIIIIGLLVTFETLFETFEFYFYEFYGLLFTVISFSQKFLWNLLGNNIKCEVEAINIVAIRYLSNGCQFKFKFHCSKCTYLYYDLTSMYYKVPLVFLYVVRKRLNILWWIRLIFTLISTVILRVTQVLACSKPDGFLRYLWLISPFYDLKDNMVSLGYLNERVITYIFIVTAVYSLDIGVSRLYSLKCFFISCLTTVTRFHPL